MQETAGSFIKSLVGCIPKAIWPEIFGSTIRPTDGFGLVQVFMIRRKTTRLSSISITKRKVKGLGYIIRMPLPIPIFIPIKPVVNFNDQNISYKFKMLLKNLV